MLTPINKHLRNNAKLFGRRPSGSQYLNYLNKEFRAAQPRTPDIRKLSLHILKTLGVRYAGSPLYYVSPNLYYERNKEED